MSERAQNLPDAFTALRSHTEGKSVRTSLERLRIDDLSPGELVVRTRYAGVNYKDSLAIAGQAKIIESFPRIAGIEFVGDVVSSGHARFPCGTAILVHGFRTGIAFDGGFSPYARVPEAHAMSLPEGLTPWETAVLGVPGFTVAMCLDRFLTLGVRPGDGPVAVSGASGAVGMLAIAILSGAGFRVTALTRKPGQDLELRALGASEVLDTKSLLASTRPLEVERFAAAIDNVGGPLLSWLLKSTQSHGCVASVGNAVGNDFPGNVLPFIMRSIQLFGVVANAPWPKRYELWSLLGSRWKPDFNRLRSQVRSIALEELQEHGRRQLAGTTRGRTLIAY